ncbi:hypothetical protein [Ornithinimicrobium kibberense]|uniref:hypothetical protein n=1 Tax=Ornithinimicrobium kibberense TaxID=282060 RepID=UPI00360A8CAE
MDRRRAAGARPRARRRGAVLDDQGRADRGPAEVAPGRRDRRRPRGRGRRRSRQGRVRSGPGAAQPRRCSTGRQEAPVRVSTWVPRATPRPRPAGECSRAPAAWPIASRATRDRTTSRVSSSMGQPPWRWSGTTVDHLPDRPGG